MNRHVLFRKRHKKVQTKLIGFNLWNRRDKNENM